jgi:hypothetical protein
MTFRPTKGRPSTQIITVPLQEQWIPTQDGEVLHSWYLTPQTQTHHPPRIILYFSYKWREPLSLHSNRQRIGIFRFPCVGH